MSAHRFAVLALGLLVASVPVLGEEGKSFYDEQGKHHFVPADGFVPDAETAIKIAEVVWFPIYGDTLQDERPFTAELIGEAWHVKGSLPAGWVGGVAEAEINKADGKILRISHGK